jgi:two-component system OmpR family response regulator
MSKSRILIVDDDRNFARLTAMTLERSTRYAVQVETRSAHALESARVFRPDLILLDMNMPGKSGAEVLLELKTNVELASTPVIFLSSLVNGFEESRHPLHQRKVRHIAKTVDSTMLLRCVDEAMWENSITHLT